MLLKTNRICLCLLHDTHKNKKEKGKEVNSMRVDIDDLIHISRSSLSRAGRPHSRSRWREACMNKAQWMGRCQGGDAVKEGAKKGLEGKVLLDSSGQDFGQARILAGS